MYVVLLKSKAQKQLEKLHRKDQERVGQEIDRIATNPFEGKKLDGEHLGKFSWRVWPYRIVYIIEKHAVTVTIIAIGHRKDVYRRLRQ